MDTFLSPILFHPNLPFPKVMRGWVKTLSDWEISILRKTLFYHKYIAKSKISTLDTKIREEGRERPRNWIFPKGLKEENVSCNINPNLKL